MKVVLLAGGLGTRISEESHLRPKPMIEIGGKPVLWHIMKEYSYYGFNEFIICAGYKQHVIKEWFSDYYLHNSDITFDFTNGGVTEIHNNVAEPWKVTIVDTGLNTMTGGRVKRIQKYVGNEPFMLTYGDGVCDINIRELLKYHQEKGKLATMTAVRVSQRFGVLDIDKETMSVKSFREKSEADVSRINAGYMVFEPEVFNYIDGDDTVLEQAPLRTLAKEGQLVAYKYNGFWQCMDTKREMEELDKMIADKTAPWMVWEKWLMKLDLNWFKDKKVLITGHTGFKGSWLCKILIDAGAEVTGYSLVPATTPALFYIANIENNMNSIIGDIRDLAHLMEVFDQVQPEIVLHLAAQPIVRDSYKDPVYTYETNVMGTVNICECVRLHPCVKSFLNVTTDKVYKNNEWEWGYRENEPLDGFDPYSNSKSCSELVTHSYINSFFADRDLAVSTARAGNVIGGGDFANDRIIPDCVRAAMAGRDIIVRNPHSTRPYQHVLEPLYMYLMIAKGQYEDRNLAGFYNVGPDDCDCVTTGELVDLFCNAWNQDNFGSPINWINQAEANAPHEANFLKLDCSKIKRTFGWAPRWGVKDAIAKTVEWSKVYATNGDISACMEKQINEFFR